MSKLKLKNIQQTVVGSTTQPLLIGGISEDGSDAKINIATNGNVTLNQVVGIKFPATQVPSADANTLDDYEEGTWTPAITCSTNGTKTYSVQVGTYTKIGRLVNCQFAIVLSSISGAGGNTTITGLPFAPSAFLAGASFAFIYGITMTAGYTVGISGRINSVPGISLKSLSDGSWTEIFGNAIASNAEIFGSITYEST